MKWISLGLLLTVLAINAVVSCTIRPAIVRARLPSYDGTNLNSGVKAQQGPGQPLLISNNARNRYNALVRLYGTRFLVPLHEDAGLVPGPAEGEWLMSPQAFVDWATMAHWHRSPSKPHQ